MNTLSVVITTLNEEANICHAVSAARGISDDVWVIDSGSNDSTIPLAMACGAQVITRKFDDMATQRNAALSDPRVLGDYVLFLDADEVVTPTFGVALTQLLQRKLGPRIDGVRICRQFHFWGKWIRSASGYPRFVDRVVRRGVVTFCKEAHGEVFVGGSNFESLPVPLRDEDRKPVFAWFERHNAYAAAEAKSILEGRARKEWRLQIRDVARRRTIVWPLASLAYYLVARGGMFEGPAGWTYCSMKSVYEFMVCVHLRDGQRGSNLIS